MTTSSSAQSLEDATPGDYSLPRPAPGRAQRGADRARRPGLRPARVLRLRHRHPGDRRPRRRRPPLQPLPRHQPVLADAGVPHDRPQPPRRRHGLPHRPADGVPRLHRPRPDVGGAAARGSCATRATTRIAIGKWHLVPGGERSVAGPYDRWPLGFGFERYYGFLQGDTNHWAPHLVRRQPLRRAAACAARRLPPHRGPRRPGDPAVTAQHAGRARPAVLPLLRARRDARAAPRRARVGRALPRRVRRRLGAVARRRVRAPARDRRRARGHRARPAPELDRRVERRLSPDAQRMLARQQEVFAGFLSHTDAQIGRVARAARTPRRARRHARHARLRQRRQRRRRRARHVQRAPLHRARPRHRRGQPRVVRRARRPALVPALLVGLGVGGQHAAAAVEALHVARRHAHAADRALAARHRRRAARCATSSCTRSTSCRPCSTSPVSTRPRRSTASRSSRSTARRSAPPSPTRAAPSPRSVQYFEMLGLALDRRRRVEGDHRPRVARASSTRSACSRAAATSPTTRGRCSASPTTSPRPTTSPPSIPTCVRDAPGAVDGRSRAQPGVPAGRRAHRPHRRGVPWPNPVPARAVYRPEGGPVPDDSVARLFGGFRLVADVDVPEHGAPAAGVLAAMGDWTGGFALFVRDGRLVFVLNRAGDEARVESDVVDTGRSPPVVVRVHARLRGPGVGLFHDDELVAHAVLPVPAPMVFQHGGTMLMLGRDRGLPVCADYEPPFPWTGVLHEVVIETGDGIPTVDSSTRPGRCCTTSDPGTTATTRSRRRGTRRGARRRRRPRGPAIRRARGAARRRRRRTPSARSTNCSMSSTVMPSSRAFASDSNTRSTIFGASPSDISSAMSSFGDAASTRARLEHLLLATRERARRLRAGARRAPGTARARGRSASLRCARGSENRSCAHRLSFTERWGNRLRDSGTNASPSLAIACDDLPVMSWPSNSTRPARGLHDAGDRGGQRRLARAVGAEHGRHRSRAHRRTTRRTARAPRRTRPPGR